jgi:hypothetical protein
VTDTFDDGIADNITLQLQGFPLQSTSHDGSGWTLRAAPTIRQMHSWPAHAVRPTPVVALSHPSQITSCTRGTTIRRGAVDMEGRVISQLCPNANRWKNRPHG